MFSGFHIAHNTLFNAPAPSKKNYLLLYPEVIHRELSVTRVSWKFLGTKVSHGQCKNGESNFTLSLVLKRGKIQLGAGVIRFADISIILTIGGCINNACWAVYLSRCQCIWDKSFLLVPHFWVKTELNLKSDDPLLTVTFSYSRKPERNRSNDFLDAEKAVALKFFSNTKAWQSWPHNVS